MLYLRTKRIINNILQKKSSTYTVNLFEDYNLNFNKQKSLIWFNPKSDFFVSISLVLIPDR